MKKALWEGLEAVLFDFEGTLVDEQWDAKGAVQETLEKLRASGFSIEGLQGKSYSLLMREAMQAASEAGRSPGEVREMIGAIYDRYDQDALSRWSLRPGAKEVLHTLQSRGMKTALVSNVGKRALTMAFQKLDLGSSFDLKVSRDDVQTMKPSGEGITLAIKQLHVRKEKVLLVGDSPDDIHAAREAGVKVILIADNKKLGRDFIATQPDDLIRNLDELLAEILVTV
jgi:phosphoglycolate phosphatase